MNYSNSQRAGVILYLTALLFSGYDLNYKEAPTFLSLTVENGAYVDRPEDPDRDKYIFAGWYSDKKYSNYFEFESVPVTEDITLFARWLNIEDKKDTDDDGIVDALEEYFGTDKTKADTDGDGLSDYVEIDSLGLDPRKKDTDDNGITDDKEDTDGDGLTNLQEMKQGTNPISADTDNDGLNDNDEVNKYDTNALKSDTDGDGVSDGKEVEMGTNPLVAEDTFDVKFVVDNEDTVTASVEIELEGNQVESLNVEQVDNDTLFPEGMPGYIGGAYDFNVYGTFDKATISFEFDAGLLGNEDFDPIIYYFNEEEQELEELQTNLNGNVASAVVNHFSKYILVNRKVYQSSFMWTDVWDTNNYTGVEIILVMDDSGSMESNDRRNSRLSVAQTLIDNLPKDSKVGVVKFESRTSLLTKKLTTDRDKAKSYLTTQHFFSSGGTYMYSAIRQSLTLFESEDDRILKMMVVLSDGDTADTRMHNSVITDANNAGVKIYTVGLGNTTSYFYGYLQPLAVNTGAKFYLASKAEELGDIYNDIKEKIDIETDSDQDGIPDYYEENMPIFNGVRLMLDKNNPDTDGDGLLDGEEIVELKYKYNSDRTKVSVTGKLKSNPASKDSDGDGLYDNEYRIAGGKKVAPVDPEPLKPNGPKGMWNSHVLSQSEKQVPVRYSSDSGLDLGVDQEIADVIVKMILELKSPVNQNEETIRNIALFVKEYCKGEAATKAGAYILNFIYDEYQLAYHSQPDTWQRSFGYNDFYDDVFRIGSFMEYDNIPFSSHQTEYALWFWKGDYWNLHSGAEIGLYKNPKNYAETKHYEAIDFELPMTLSLYNYYSENEIRNVFSWAPEVKQWWITGFNPRFTNPDPDVMVTMGSIDFVGYTELFDALKGTVENGSGKMNKEYFIFDKDGHTLWILWDKGVAR